MKFVQTPFLCHISSAKQFHNLSQYSMDAFVIRTKKSSLKNGNKSSLVKSRSYSTSSRLSSTTSQSNSSISSSSDVGALNKIKPDWGQRKISDLDGVVILEKIQEYVQKLSDPNVASVAKVKWVEFWFKT